MGAVTFVVAKTTLVLLEVLQFAMLVRAILSWIPLSDDNKIERFVYALTEPIIYPIRVLLSRFSTFQSMPIDFSFFITYILLILLSTLLSSYG
ncbi:MAG: YggT family protein [Clostridia bacterium]|nr:YggT family protein [Clostridia bacterium]